MVRQDDELHLPYKQKDAVMPNSKQYTKYGSTPIVQMILAAAVSAGIIDDLTVALVVDNPLVIIALVVLEGFVIRAKVVGASTLGRTFLKSFLTIGAGVALSLLSLDDLTVAGILDNPLAAVFSLPVIVMGFKDWRRER